MDGSAERQPVSACYIYPAYGSNAWRCPAAASGAAAVRQGEAMAGMGGSRPTRWVWLALLVRQTSPQSTPMKVESWSHVEEWRPFVREVAQVVLNSVDGATGVDQILEHRTQVAPVVAYQAEVEFGPSSDGRKKAFNASARVFDSSFEWYAVSGTTMHTQLWLEQQHERDGPPSPPTTMHTLGMLDATVPKDSDWQRQQRRRQQQQLSPLLPKDIPTTMAVQVRGAAEFSVVPSIPVEQLANGEALPSDLRASGLSIQPGVAVTLRGVEAMSLAEPVPLECDLPFRWHPPLVFPPLEGGRRLAGWFMVSGLAKVEAGGALSVTLSPSKDPVLRSMPKGWVPVGLAGVVATWDVNGEDDGPEDDESDSEDVEWKSQLLQDLGLQDDGIEDQGQEEQAEVDGEGSDSTGGTSAELLRLLSDDQDADATMQSELPDSSSAPVQELVFFKGMLTDQTTGIGLSFCPGGFSMTRSVISDLEGHNLDAPLFIEDTQSTRPAEWDDAEDGEWAPAMIVNPSAAASSLGLGPGWEGSYECVGNPTRARMTIVETVPGRLPNTIKIVANMSFDTVTQTGGFAVRPAKPAHAESFRFKLKGTGTTVGADDTSGTQVGYTAEVVETKQEQESQVVLHPRAGTRPGPSGSGPFIINATDLRIVNLLDSVERVFNQTKQVAIRLTNASVQPIVIFRVVMDVIIPGDILRVEAVVERLWGGMKRPRPVVLMPSSADSNFAEVTSLVSTSLLKGDQAIDLVELAEQLKLAPEAVEALQRALTEPEPRDDASDEESSGTLDDAELNEAARQEDARAETLRQRIQRDQQAAQAGAEEGGTSEPPEHAQDGADETSGGGLGLLAHTGWGVRVMRQAFRQVVNYNVFPALWRTLEDGYRNLMGIPVGVPAPLQAGLLLMAAVPVVIAFVSLLGLLEFRAINRRRALGN